jgi:peptide/nickel transport system permease protein
MLPAEKFVDSEAIRADVDHPRRELLSLLGHSKTFLIGGTIVSIWGLCALFGSSIAPHDPLGQDLLAVNQRPSGAHWFGTDQLGRDVLSRVVVGSRDILVIAPLATVLGTVLGTALGLVMGYFRGLVDNLISRVIEAVLALPVVIVVFVFVVALGPSTATLIIVIGSAFAPSIARTVRSAVLLERQLDYVASARLRGESSIYTLAIEVLPNVTSPILVELTIRLGYAIFAVATLSFLGFGIQPPQPDWGGDVSANYGLITAGYWWETLFPALAIASLVVAVNLMADTIEAVLDT